MADKARTEEAVIVALYRNLPTADQRKIMSLIERTPAGQTETEFKPNTQA